MIPNTLQFSLDLTDLPARATQVSPEAIKLSTGMSQAVIKLRANGGKGPRARTTQFSPSQANKACRGFCRLNYAVGGKAFKVGRSGNRYWNCRCNDASRFPSISF